MPTKPTQPTLEYCFQLAKELEKNGLNELATLLTFAAFTAEETGKRLDRLAWACCQGDPTKRRRALAEVMREMEKSGNDMKGLPRVR